MIREVNLPLYLPGFMSGYKEPVAVLEAENPEFYELWQEKEQIFFNRFISKANENGISRFEKMMGLCPSLTDSLEVRKDRVYMMWNNTIPYTKKALIERLNTLLGTNGYVIDFKNVSTYSVEIKLELINKAKYRIVKDLLYALMPENVVIHLDLIFNTHGVLSGFTHMQLSGYKHKGLRDEVIRSGS